MVCVCGVRSTKQQWSSWRGIRSVFRRRKGGKLWVKKPNRIKRWETVRTRGSALHVDKGALLRVSEALWQSWCRVQMCCVCVNGCVSLTESSVPGQTGSSALWGSTPTTGSFAHTHTEHGFLNTMTLTRWVFLHEKILTFVSQQAINEENLRRQEESVQKQEAMRKGITHSLTPSLFPPQTGVSGEKWSVFYNIYICLCV